MQKVAHWLTDRRRRTTGIVLAVLATAIAVGLVVVAIAIGMTEDNEAEDLASAAAVAWVLALVTGSIATAAWAMPRRRLLVAGLLVVPVAAVGGTLWLKHLTGL